MPTYLRNKSKLLIQPLKCSEKRALVESMKIK